MTPLFNETMVLAEQLTLTAIVAFLPTKRREN